MAKQLIFLSHAGVDSEAALRLARLIEGGPAAQEQGLKIWFDKRDLAVGQGWQSQLEDIIEKQSTAFAVYLGSTGVMNWVESEVRLGLSRATVDKTYPFIPILGPHCAGSKVLPAFARQYHGVRDPEGNPDELQKLLRAALGLEGLEPVEIVAHPFLGLRAFEEEQAHLFFVRREETRELVERLGKTNLLMVVGDSGSGKSSLVKAGLVPAIRGGALADFRGGQPDDTVWHVLKMRPRSNPFEQLIEAATAGLDAATSFAIADRIRTRELAKIGDALAAATAPRAKTLLVVDQFEELWTLTPEADRRAFVDILLGLALANEDRQRVVLTMRRDYYNLCSALPDLYRLLEGAGGLAKYSVRRMSDAGLRACITEPLRLGGVADAGVFADEVLRDVGDEPADLALLEMALTEAWRHRAEFKNDLLQAYIGSGRVAGALAQAADRVFEERLKKEPLDLVKGVFVRLVRLGDTGGTTRRVATRDEFRSEAWRIVQDLASEDSGRLLQIGGESEQETIELSHEALVTQWPRYQTWLEEAAPDKRALDTLIADAKRWGDAPDDKKVGLLATGYDLDAATEILRKPGRMTWLSDTEQAFIDASEAARRAEAADRRREQRRRKILLRVSTGAALLAAAAAIVAVFFWYQRSQTLDEVRSTNAKLTAAFKELEYEKKNVETAQKEANQRAKQLQISVGHQLGATAQRLLDPLTDDTAPAVAALATEGWRLGASSDAWNAAQRLPITGSTTEFTHNGRVLATAFSPDGRLLATGSWDNTARLFETADGKEVARIAHDGAVLAVAFSPDGRLLATGSDDNTARLIETADGKEVARITHDGAVNAVAFSPDGHLLATGSDDRTARLIQTTNGREVARITHEGPVRTIDFSPDGRVLATGSNDNTARLSETADGKEVARITHDGWVNAVAFSPNGHLLATGSDDNTARLIETADGKEVARITHESTVYGITFSPDGRRLATASFDKTARLIETADGKEVARIAHDDVVSAVAFSPDGHLLATGSDDNTARLIESADGKEVARITHDGDVYAVTFSPDGRLLATGSHDRTARLIEIPDGKEVARTAHDDVVAAVAFSPDSRLLATGSLDTTVRLIEPADGTEVARITHDDTVYAVAFSPDGSLLATGSEDGTARLIETADGKEVARITHDGPVWTVVFSPDGRLVATGSADGTARLIETDGGEEVARITHDGPVRAVAFSPDGRRLATGSDDRTARLIQATNGKEVARITHDGPISAVAFSPDGRWLATGSWDHTARLIATADGKEVARITHDDTVYAVAFSPDGSLLATGSWDHTARLIATADGKEVARITLDGAVLAVAFSPDGRLLVIAADRSLYVWSTDLDEVFRKLCQQHGRNLSLQEWRRYVGDQPWQPTCDCWTTPSEVVEAGLWPPKDRAVNCPKQ